MMASKWFKRQYRELSIEVDRITPNIVFTHSNHAHLHIHSDHAGTMRIEMTREQFKELAENMLDLIDNK